MAENSSTREVIFCRGVVEDNVTRNDYVETFKSAGFACKHLPVLDFRFRNLENLATRLYAPNSYSGLILTSRRSIEAIVRALDGRALPSEWKNFPSYCVGPATSRCALEMLGLHDRTGSNCGNSRELASHLTSERSRLRDEETTKSPLLYPCSAIARDTIECALSEACVMFEKIVVYATTPGEKLDDDLTSTLLPHGAPRIVVFFSPSAVEFTIEAAKRRELSTRDIRAVAIGPTTAEALERAGLEVRAVSARPEPVALLDAVREAIL